MATGTLNVEIITPEKKVFSGEAVGVQVPGSEGRFEVLYNHAPLISTLSKGPVKVKTASAETAFMIEGGVAEVLNNKVIILAESIINEKA